MGLRITPETFCIYKHCIVLSVLLCNWITALRGLLSSMEVNPCSALLITNSHMSISTSSRRTPLRDPTQSGCQINITKSIGSFLRRSYSFIIKRRRFVPYVNHVLTVASGHITHCYTEITIWPRISYLSGRHGPLGAPRLAFHAGDISCSPCKADNLSVRRV